MGHMVAKDVYKQLGKKIDGLSVRVPWNNDFYSLLKELYSLEEAELLIKMPYALSTLNRVQAITGWEATSLQKILENLCFKGLVIDLYLKDTYYYMPSPMVIGIYEFTMMRTGEPANSKKRAELLNTYINSPDTFWAANFSQQQKTSFMRTLPHEEIIHVSEYMEILDYEKATALVESFDKFAIATCSCRHEKHHLGEKTCSTPLEMCSSFGQAADYLVRRGLAKKVSKSKMLENLAHAKELGLVFNADNIQNKIMYICLCCKCCCTALSGISRHGFSNAIVTSNYLAHCDQDLCTGCGKCVKACPIDVITLEDVKVSEGSKPKKHVTIDHKLCLGCGVCGLKCPTHAITLKHRPKKVIHPETTFERVILQCLERGTLQNQIFDNPQSITEKTMRAVLGAFLNLPAVKRSLMSNTLRSVFLSTMKSGIKWMKREWLLDV
ncbi:4Fe-4S binding protein [bacterium]|nr:4Fe-4S binding protein [bacterium]